MKIEIELSHNDYMQLTNSDKRTVGSLWLTDDRHGTFKCHKPRKKTDSPYRRLSHGRVTCGNQGVRLTLTVRSDETGAIAEDIISRESWYASEFVREMKKKDDGERRDGQ